jgi:hypothetical protein
MKKRKAAGNQRDETATEKELISAFERVTARKYPNANRVGCPPLAKLRLIAEPGVKVSADIVDHIGKCWPCVQDLRQMKLRGTRKIRPDRE